MILITGTDTSFVWDAEKRFTGTNPEDVSRKINVFLADGRDTGTVNASRVTEVYKTVDPEDPDADLYCAMVYYNR